MQEMYSMLAEFGGHMRHDDEVLLQDLHEASTAIVNEVVAARAFATQGKSTNIGKLKSEIESLIVDVKDIRAECASGRFDDSTLDIVITREALASMSEKVCTTD
jgi:hypothetical protein